MISVSEAEVNQYKRKKKRRQLDALVDNMKLPRGRKNSSHELLDYQSGSSDIEEFSVAARNPARRKSCFCDSLVAKVIYFIVSVTCISICIGLIWIQWHIRQDLTSLSDRITKVERSEIFTPDSMTKFQTQLVSLNKSLTELRTGSGGIKDLAASIEELKTKVKDFESTSVELNKAVSSSKDFFDLPKKFDDLTTIVADMKNDVNTTAAIRTKQDELENRLTALENAFKTTKSSNTDTSEMTRLDGQLLEQVKQLNQTMIERLASVTSRLDQQEARMSTMEEFINRSATSSPIAISLVNKLVKDAMQDYMGNLTSPDSPPAGELTEVLKRVEGMVQSMQQFKMDGENIVTKGEFLVFKDIVMDDFKNVNTSLIAFNNEFEEIFKHITLLESFMKNNTISHQVDATVLASVSPRTNTSTTKPGITGNSEDPNADGNNTPEVSENPKRTEEGSEGNMTKKPENAVASEGLKHTIKVENVTNMRDLVEAYNKMKPTMAPMNREELTAFLGGRPVPEELMTAMDTNGDGLYSALEIAEFVQFVTPSDGSPGSPPSDLSEGSPGPGP